VQGEEVEESRGRRTVTFDLNLSQYS
jgi:predicted translin family RNA/ssDNA-binding protein